MKWLDKLVSRFGYVNRANVRMVRRNYAAAAYNRLNADWVATGTSGDAELKQAHKSLRDRCREQERNDDYMVSYLSLADRNVLGSTGVKLQMKIMDPTTGKPDKMANQAIEDAWAKWGRPENCTARRTVSWRSLCGLALKSSLRDGGLLALKLEGFQNAFGWAVQPMEIDHLDTDYELRQPGPGGGVRVRMGIELDQWDAPIGYHLFSQHPGHISPHVIGEPRRIFVPANRIIHLFRPKRVSEIIGAPVASAALSRLKMFSAYEEAELIAAREGACKGYAITQASPDGYVGEDDGTGRQLENVEPGMKLLLNPGEELHDINPTHPTDAFPEFTKTILRGVASGLGVSYTSLTGDLEGVNYSSIRAGLLEEREEWKSMQEWFICEFITPIFEEWLAWSLRNGHIKLPNGSALPFHKFEQFNQPNWQGRRWPWVDPLKEAEADIKAIAARLKSRRQVVAEDGGDIETIDADFAADPVTSDIDTDSVYAPDSPPPKPPGGGEPVRINGNGNGVHRS